VDTSPSKKKKKKKDPNKPKTPQSAFLYFSRDKRKEVVTLNPEIKFAEVGKKLGEMWSKMTEADKKDYEFLAQKDRLRYKTEMDNYSPPVAADSDEDDKKSKKRKRKKKDPDEPKGAPSAYILYANSVRDKIKTDNPAARFTDTGRIIGKMWKELSAEEKQPFNDDAQRLRLKSQQEKEDYKKTHKNKDGDTDAPPRKRAKKEKKAPTPPSNTTKSEEEVKKSDEANDDENTDTEKKKDDKDDDDDSDDDDDDDNDKDDAKHDPSDDDASPE